MAERRQNDREVFPCAFGASGEVGDEGLTADADDGPGDHGVGRLFHAFGAHGLGHAGDFLVDNGKGRVGRQVAGAYARSPRREDEVAAHFVGACAEDFGDPVHLVGDDGRMHHLGSDCTEQREDLRTAEILPLASGTFIADRDDGCPDHGAISLLRLSSSWRTRR